MSQYLILHKVRGEPSFDCAEKVMIGDEEGWITNSGYRAYPVFTCPMSDIRYLNGPSITEILSQTLDFASVPDHFNVTKEPPTVKIGLGELMAMVMPKLRRRI